VLDSLSGLKPEGAGAKNGARMRSATPTGRQTPSGKQTPSGRTSSVRSASRNGRQSLGVGATVGIDYLVNDSVFHPLKSTSGATVSKRQRVSRQRDHIPVYPEEPAGKDAMSSLKKSWSILLPAESVEVLFPGSGFQKQDDATDGCALLSHALFLSSRDGEENVVIEQLDLILRWFSLALCSRETTSGMEPLLTLFSDLVALLHRQSYQFSDGESASVLPYILEKAGVAKVRQIKFGFFFSL